VQFLLNGAFGVICCCTNSFNIKSDKRTLFRHLRSASSTTLIVPPTRRATIGDHAFPAAASCAWTSLPTLVREIRSLPAFRRKLFAISFPADWPWNNIAL